VSGTRRDSGFTLLEILIALVVLGALMLALRQGVSVGVAAWNAQERLVAGREDLDAVARALRRLIEHMDPGTELEPVRLAAGPHALSFPTELPVAAVALPTRSIEAALLVNEGHALVLRWTPRLHAVRIEPPPVRETELLRGVDQLDLAYWDPAGAAWRDAWRGTDLPALVRIRIVFLPGDRRRWPDIVAAPARERPPE